MSFSLAGKINFGVPANPSLAPWWQSIWGFHWITISTNQMEHFLFWPRARWARWAGSTQPSTVKSGVFVWQHKPDRSTPLTQPSTANPTLPLSWPRARWVRWARLTQPSTVKSRVFVWQQQVLQARQINPTDSAPTANPTLPLFWPRARWVQWARSTQPSTANPTLPLFSTSIYI